MPQRAIKCCAITPLSARRSAPSCSCRRRNEPPKSWRKCWTKQRHRSTPNRSRSRRCRPVAHWSMPGASRLFYFVSYLAFRVGEVLIRLLPLDCAFIVVRAGGEVAYRILRHRRQLALANLRLAFGHEMSEAHLGALNRLHFQLL